MRVAQSNEDMRYDIRCIKDTAQDYQHLQERARINDIAMGIAMA